MAHDFRESAILVYRPDGSLLRTYERTGRGPGEFRKSPRLFAGPSDALLAVADGRLTRFAVPGFIHAGTHPLSIQIGWRATVLRDGRIATGASTIAVPAAVRFARAVQADVDETGRGLLDARPVGRVRDDQGRAGAPADAHQLRREERVGADLERVPDAPATIRLRPRILHAQAVRARVAIPAGRSRRASCRSSSRTCRSGSPPWVGGLMPPGRS